MIRNEITRKNSIHPNSLDLMMKNKMMRAKYSRSSSPPPTAECIHQLSMTIEYAFQYFQYESAFKSAQPSQHPPSQHPPPPADSSANAAIPTTQ
jgi:hypothetical protein